MLIAVTLLSLFALAGPGTAPARADSTRVSIADFQWSKNPVISRGESVIWDWPGPDIQHSVSPNPAGSNPWDSDPGTSVPHHTLGDTFTATFEEPGTYKFICKLHPSVRGTVTVKDEPGNPASDPGPPPPLNIDLEPPHIDRWYFARAGGVRTPGIIGPHGNGIRFLFATPERGTAEVDYYRLIPRFRRKVMRKRDGSKVRRRILVRRQPRYAGYTEWKTHVGFNTVRFAARSATFPDPRPGRYLAKFRATDEEANTTRPIRLRFRIRPGRKP